MSQEPPRQRLKIVTAKGFPWPAMVAVRCEDGVEIDGIVSVDFHHDCDSIPSATIVVQCDQIDADAYGVVTAEFMGKKYRLVELQG